MIEGTTAEVIRLSRAAGVAIPAETLRMAKLCLLDWFGVTFAGMREPVVTHLLSLVQQEGGRPVATILGQGRLFSVRQAALVNGTAAHALDYDDVSLEMNVHPTAVIASTVLALAEARDSAGSAVLRAFVVGYEAAALIGRLIARGHYARGFHATGTIGAFGAAAAAAELLDLDVEATAYAYGLAASRAAGLKAQFGTMAKPLHAGFAAEAGIVAATLAEAGITACTEILEAGQGFAATQTEGSSELPRWKSYALNRNIFKFHASCFGTHGTLEAIAILKSQDLHIDDVRDVCLTVHPLLRTMCNIAEPRDAMEAKFSLRFNAALALVGADTADPDTYNISAVKRADLARISALTRVQFGAPDWPEDLTEVATTFADGTVRIARYDTSSNSANLPARLADKFRTLTASAGDRSVATIERLLANVDQIEETNLIRELLASSHWAPSR